MFLSNRRVRGSVPGLGGLKETKMFLPHPRVKVSIVGSLRDREVACSASDRQGSNFESCVWRTVSFQSSHHPQEVLLSQFSLYVHKGGLKTIHFISFFIFLRHQNVGSVTNNGNIRPKYNKRVGRFSCEIFWIIFEKNIYSMIRNPFHKHIQARIDNTEYTTLNMVIF